VVGSALGQSVPRGPWEEVLAETGGGVLLGDGLDLIDTIRFLGGDIAAVSGKVHRHDQRHGVEDTAIALLHSSDGVPIFFEAGGQRDHCQFELDLQLEKGRLRIGNNRREFFASEPSRDRSGVKELTSRQFPPPDRQSDPFCGCLEELLSAITEDRPEGAIESSGSTARQSMEIAFAIYYSAFLGGRQVQLPLQVSGHPLRKLFQTQKL
jgi:predicted dehydrogenase